MENLTSLQPLTLERWLDVAVALASTIYEHHEQGKLFGERLRPANINVQFGNETRVRISNAPASRDALELLDGFTYTAPELTGRWHQSEGPDARADVYLLGLILHEAFTGRPCFAAGSALELIHAHLARPPKPVSHVSPSPIPEVVERIVDRCLAKMPGSRYQSAFGVLHDLQRCRASLREAGAVASFELGERDRSGQLALPDLLYGRAAPLNRALAAARAVAQSGRPALFALRGLPGAGKTFLVREAARRALEEGTAAFFVSGKADQFNRLPFSCWSRALQDLVRQLLATREEGVAAWRAALLAALQGKARLLVELAPAAKLLLGADLAPLPEVPGPEAQARLQLALAELFRAASPRPPSPPALALEAAGGEARGAPAGRGPVIVLLDDMHWADLETVKLVESLLAAPTPDLPILLCMTYRESEVAERHPLAQFLARARESFPVYEAEAAPMRREDCCSLLADVLRWEGGPEEPRLGALAGAILRKTLGNPLHVLAFLRHLHARRILRFSHPEGAWRWSQGEVEGAEEGASLGEMVETSIGLLPAATQHALKVASCCGATFSVPLLAAILGCSEEEIVPLLRPALAAGLLLIGEPQTLRAASPLPAPRGMSLSPARALGDRRRSAPAVAQEIASAALQVHASHSFPVLCEAPEAGAAGGAAGARRPGGARGALRLGARLGLLPRGLALAAAPPLPGRPRASLFELANLVNQGLAAGAAAAERPPLLEAARLNAAAARRSYEMARRPLPPCPPPHAPRAVLVPARGALRAGRLRFLDAAPRRRAGGAAGAAAVGLGRALVGGEGRRAEEGGELAFELRVLLADLPAAHRAGGGGGDYGGALEAGLECGRELFGLTLPAEPTMADLEAEFEALLAALRPSEPRPGPGAAADWGDLLAALPEAVARLPECTDRRTLDLMQVCGECVVAASLHPTACPLVGILPARAVRLSLEAGRAPQTGFMAGALAHAASASTASSPSSRPSPRPALPPPRPLPRVVTGRGRRQVCVRFGGEGRHARVRAKALVAAATCCIWGDSFRASMHYAEQCFGLARELGDLVDASAAASAWEAAALGACERLPALERRLLEHRRFFAEHRNGSAGRSRGPHRPRPGPPGQAGARGAGPFVQGPSPASARRPPSPHASPELAPAMGESSPRPSPRPASGPLGPAAFSMSRVQAETAALPAWARWRYRTLVALRLLFFGDTANAWRVLGEYEWGGALEQPLRAAFSCHQDLVLALGLLLGRLLSPGHPPAASGGVTPASLPSSPSVAALSSPGGAAGRGSGETVPAVPEAGRLLARLEGVLLLDAELARARGESAAAARLYDAAADAAEAARFHSLAGLAGERAASLLLDMGARRGVEGYLRAAARAYALWARRRRPLKAVSSLTNVAGAAGARAASAGLKTVASAGDVHAQELLHRPRPALGPAPSPRAATLLRFADSAAERRTALLRSAAAASGGPAPAPGEEGGEGVAAPARMPRNRSGASSHGTGCGEEQSFDWETLVAASQLLSREIVLSTLLQRLMTVAMEIAGAQRGFLILEQEDGSGAGAGAGAGREGAPGAASSSELPAPERPGAYSVEAAAEVAGPDEGPARRARAPPRRVAASRAGGRAGEEAEAGPGPGRRQSEEAGGERALQVTVMQGLPLAECGDLLCLRAVESALATEEIVLVQDVGGREEGAQLSFESDPYVAGAGVKSLLALPVLHQGRPVGCLYLENRLLRGAFSPSSIETLGILSSQLAISIVNARLYESLRAHYTSLQQRARENAAVLEASHDAILVLDDRAHILSANPAAEKLWRRARRELLGLRLDDLLVPPLSALLMQEALGASPGGRPLWAGFALGEGGAHIEVELCVAVFEGGAGRRHGALTAASSSASLLEARAASAGHEPAPAHRLATCPEEPFLLPPASAPPTTARPPLSRAASQRRFSPLVGPLASPFFNGAAPVPGPPAGGPKRFAAFVRDVSERAKAEEQLRRVQKRWFAMLTHDLRTPLNGPPVPPRPGPRAPPR
eukprot:tig00021721_g23214.t1